MKNNDKKYKDIVKSGYDRIANAYHEQKEPDHNVDLLERFTSYLNQGSYILDAGCGAGVPTSKYLVQQGFFVTGIDISDSMISLAKQNVPDGAFLKMDMESLEFKNDTFDALVSSYVIFHIKREKHASIYQRFSEILKPGGIILISVGYSDWEGIEDFYGTNMYWSHYSWEVSLNLLRDVGFEILHYETRYPPDDGRHVWVFGKNKDI